MEALLGDCGRGAQPPPSDCYAVLFVLPGVGRGGWPCRLAHQCIQPSAESVGMQRWGRGGGRTFTAGGCVHVMLIWFFWVAT